MSEEITKDLNGDSTNPLPLEELVTRPFEALMNRFDQVEARLERVEKDVRDLKLDSQGIKAQLFKVEDRIRDLDDKVDAFVRESLYLKRELREFQESLGAKN
jgi:septal ring factor EnvC (AmiA/AmiB activator)